MKSISKLLRAAWSDERVRHAATAIVTAIALLLLQLVGSAPAP